MEWRVKSGKSLLVAVACLVGSVCCVPVAVESNETEFGKDHPTLLVENIRRQLMNENYDYMPSESEEKFIVKHELSNEAVTPHSSPTLHNKSNGSINELDSDLNDHFFLGAKDQSIDDFEIDKSHPISKKDLLYYVDDHRLKNTEGAWAGADEDNDDTTTTNAETVKYKILKVKQPPSYRRNQKNPYRRFIQEEGENGVVIMNLDDEPFPQFRLPKSRRQYMMDHDDRDRDLELAPSTDDEEDFLATGFEKFDNNYNIY